MIRSGVDQQGTPLLGVDPFPNRLQRILPGHLQNLRSHMKSLEKGEIIKKVESLEIPKTLVSHNVSIVFSLDYQNFKKHTTPDLFNDVNIANALNLLVGNKFFSVLSLISELGQVPMYPGEREKPYSMCPLGFYETEQFQPGYCEALATFQGLMAYVLRGMPGMLVYLDYIIVFGKTQEEHKELLERVFERLGKDNWKVSLAQCHFACSSVSYAGHEVSASGIVIDPSKIKVMSTWPKPKTVTELKCFLDFCRHYRQFLEGFSEMAKPLNHLLQKAVSAKEAEEAALGKRPWWIGESIVKRWTKECDEAFDRLKHSVIHAPVLQRVSMNQPQAQGVKSK